MTRIKNTITGSAMFSSALRQRSHESEKGFALLIAVIFMSVMLTFGLSLGALGYKQQVLASSAIGSQYAFYSADAALECVLYADQQQHSFEYADHDANTPPNLTSCDGGLGSQLAYSYDVNRLTFKQNFKLDGDTRCAEVTVYKPPSGGTTYLFSQGYDVPCSVVQSNNGARFVSRGLNAHY